MGPGVGGEGDEALDGFDVGGVVVAHDCAGAGEEAVGVGVGVSVWSRHWLSAIDSRTQSGRHSRQRSRTGGPSSPPH